MSREHRGRRGQEGFTLIEVLIALLILLIGISGVLTLQMVSVRATNYSRHATEAAVVGEQKLEDFRVWPDATLVDGSDRVDERGQDDPDGLYTRTWTVLDNGDSLGIRLEVSWLERGSEPYGITFHTTRRRTL